MEFKNVKYEINLKDCPVTGAVFLKKPSIQQLFEGSEIAKKQEENQLQAVKSLIEWSKQFYIKLELKNIDGSVYSNFEDLMEDSECLEVLNDVASALVIGVNKKKLQEKTEKTNKKGA
ncbi:MAG: hypothetical protein IPJ03_16485 [Ignavibacteriales bacterium]|nr:hypothetical protein [Ignavibacteriales bacterium]